MAGSFVFDPNRCTGCEACRLACTIENELVAGHSWRRIETYNPRHVATQPLYHLSLACNHCAVPACMHACPARAYSRDLATGAMILDPDKCIGCHYCAWACPYDAPVFDDDRGVMTKCTFCRHRLIEGLDPACVSSCPTGALGFADLDEHATTSGVAEFPQSDLQPRIRIEPLRAERRLPAMTTSPADPVFTAVDPASESGISLRTEWPLMLFTLSASVAVALVGATVGGSPRPAPLAFAALAAMTLLLASAHLGRKKRAWRAVLNLRSSWLSREIVLLTAFLGGAMLWLTWRPDSLALGILLGLLGFCALVCVDQVYGVLPRAGAVYLHSAGALWTSFLLTGVFGGDAAFAAPFAAGKLALYVVRKLRLAEAGRDPRWPTALARISIGLLAPLVLWWAGPVGARPLVVAGVLIGELIDRGEFYLELERESPRRRMAEALVERATGPARVAHPA